MFARVSLFREPVDDAIRVIRERVVPVVLGLPGSRGGFFLVDREEGRTLSLTLWASCWVKGEKTLESNRWLAQWKNLQWEFTHFNNVRSVVSLLPET